MVATAVSEAVAFGRGGSSPSSRTNLCLSGGTVDAAPSKSAGRKVISVRVRGRAPTQRGGFGRRTGMRGRRLRAGRFESSRCDQHPDREYFLGIDRRSREMFPIGKTNDLTWPSGIGDGLWTHLPWFDSRRQDQQRGWLWVSAHLLQRRGGRFDSDLLHQQGRTRPKGQSREGAGYPATRRRGWKLLNEICDRSRTFSNVADRSHEIWQVNRTVAPGPSRKRIGPRGLGIMSSACRQHGERTGQPRRGRLEGAPGPRAWGWCPPLAAKSELSRI